MKLRGAQAVSFCEALQPEVPFPVPTHPLFPIRPRNAFPPMSVPFLVHPAILARRLPPRTDVLRLPLTSLLGPSQTPRPSSWEAEIRLPSGVTLALAPGVPLSRVLELVEALRC